MLSSSALHFARMGKRGRDLELESSKSDFHCTQESDDDFRSKDQKCSHSLDKNEDHMNRENLHDAVE